MGPIQQVLRRWVFQPAGTRQQRVKSTCPSTHLTIRPTVEATPIVPARRVSNVCAFEILRNREHAWQAGAFQTLRIGNDKSACRQLTASDRKLFFARAGWDAYETGNPRYAPPSARRGCGTGPAPAPPCTSSWRGVGGGWARDGACWANARLLPCCSGRALQCQRSRAECRKRKKAKIQTEPRENKPAKCCDHPTAATAKSE
jgi:hypothetical protein